MHLIYSATLKVLCLTLLLPIAAVANLDFVPLTLIHVNTSQPFPDSLGRRHPSQYLYKRRSNCCTSDEASCCPTSGQTCCSFSGRSFIDLGQSYNSLTFFLGNDRWRDCPECCDQGKVIIEASCGICWANCSRRQLWLPFRRRDVMPRQYFSVSWHSKFTSNHLPGHVKYLIQRSNHWRCNCRSCVPHGNNSGHYQTRKSTNDKHPVEPYNCHSVSHTRIESIIADRQSCKATSSERSVSVFQWRRRKAWYGIQFIRQLILLLGDLQMYCREC